MEPAAHGRAGRPGSSSRRRPPTRRAAGSPGLTCPGRAEDFHSAASRERAGFRGTARVGPRQGPGGGRAETQNLRSCFQFAARPSGVGRSADGAYLRASPGRLCGPLACPPSPWLSVCLSFSLTSLCLVESRKSLRSLVPLKGGNQLPLTPRCWLLRSGRPPGPSLAEKKRWLCPPGTEWLRKSRPQSSASGQ